MTARSNTLLDTELRAILRVPDLGVSHERSCYPIGDDRDPTAMVRTRRFRVVAREIAARVQALLTRLVWAYFRRMADRKSPDRAAGWATRLSAWPLQLVMGLFWSVFGTLYLLFAQGSGRDLPRALLGCLFVALGIGYFVLALTTRRREKRAEAAISSEAQALEPLDGQE